MILGTHFLGEKAVPAQSAPIAETTPAEPAPAASEGMNIIIAEDDISIKGLLTILLDAEMTASVDQDGDIEISIDDFTIFVRHVPDKQRLTFMSFADFNKQTTSEERLRFCNTINAERVFIKASIVDENPNRLILDHDVSTEAGITIYQFIALTIRFARASVFAIEKGEGGILE